MSNVTREERKMQRKAKQRMIERSDPYAPISLQNVKESHSYWITGYYWEHDVVLLEPFCAVKVKAGWAISNLSKNDIEYYQANKLLSGDGAMFIFEDRVTALDVCEAIENQNILLDSFSGYMTDEQLVEYLKSVGGKV